MPKRIVDGEGIWSSQRIAKVEPAWVRAEVPWLLPLSLANGVFECEPRQIWARCYACVRPNVAPEDVVAILNSLVEAGILYPWVDEHAKTWGTWYGLRGKGKEGRLPPLSRRGEKEQRHERIGPEPTPEISEALERGQPMASRWLPNGCLGLGLGLGSGQVRAKALACPMATATPTALEDSPSLQNGSNAVSCASAEPADSAEEIRVRERPSGKADLTSPQAIPSKGFVESKTTEEDQVSEIWKAVGFDPSLGLTGYEHEPTFREVCQGVYSELRHERWTTLDELLKLQIRAGKEIVDRCKAQGFGAPPGLILVLSATRKDAKDLRTGELCA